MRSREPVDAVAADQLLPARLGCAVVLQFTIGPFSGLCAYRRQTLHRFHEQRRRHHAASSSVSTNTSPECCCRCYRGTSFPPK